MAVLANTSKSAFIFAFLNVSLPHQNGIWKLIKNHIERFKGRVIQIFYQYTAMS